MKIGSLFSGIGGIELGFEKAGGYKTIWFVEKEPYAKAILRKHWPNIPIYGDITKINFKKLPKPDILTGGFPCQDISNAGKRKGIEGQRSGLWKEFLRAISQIRPKYTFVENVSALTYRGLLTVLGDLAQVGYDAEWHCLPASAIGAPHRRDRIYIISCRNSRFNKQQEQKIQTRRNTACNKSKNLENTKCNRIDERNRQKNDSRKESKQYPNKLGGTSTRSRNTKNVAYTNSNRRKQGTDKKLGTSSKKMANANKQGLQRRHKEKYSSRKPQEKIRRGSNTFPNTKHINSWKQRKKSLREKNRQKTWATDTGILRVAHGIPNRIHRIKCLGNAVVPQCAEFFAEIIKEKENELK